MKYGALADLLRSKLVKKGADRTDIDRLLADDHLKRAAALMKSCCDFDVDVIYEGGELVSRALFAEFGGCPAFGDFTGFERFCGQATAIVVNGRQS